MSTDPSTLFHEMSEADATAMLARSHFGRLAFTYHDRVDIEPISFRVDDNWLYMRTSEGTKLQTLRHHPWVALEVDEVRNQHDWDSVVARGTMYLLTDTGSATDHAIYQHALAILRDGDAGIFTKSDAAPHRTQLIRMHINEISGRRARPVRHSAHDEA